MRIAYCTNIWNHYQGAFCQEMANLYGDDFKMVLFTPMEKLGEYDGSKMGAARQPWVMSAPAVEWIVQPPQRASEHIDGIWNQLMADADVAVVGFCEYMSCNALKKRERAGKPTFFLGERIFKRRINFTDYFDPRQWRRWITLHCLLNGKHTSYLEISSEGYKDLHFLRVCKNRIYQWGYFPKVSDVFPQKRRTEKLRMGWCGRMLDWKHVEYIVQAFASLTPAIAKQCEVVLVGEGPEKSKLVEMVDRLKIANSIKFETYMPINRTMDFMRSLDVYLFPSGRGEGWGVALNEAMDKGCVPIANAEAGATLELVDDGENGFVFQDGDISSFAKAIELLVNDRSRLADMSYAAWQKIQKWSPKGAAEILKRITEKKEIPVEGLGRIRG